MQVSNISLQELDKLVDMLWIPNMHSYIYQIQYITSI